ncbi:MAG: hypothetical protein JO210_18665 [Acidobacteriaceae bacterium]|nr:hypothetical protein [Acidobacteriaceae bacterium]
MNRDLGLDAQPADGDILQIAHPPSLSPGVITPDQLYEIRAKQARIRPTFLHLVHNFSSAEVSPATMRLLLAKY